MVISSLWIGPSWGGKGQLKAELFPWAPESSTLSPSKSVSRTPLAASVGWSPAICIPCPSFPACPINSSDLFSAAYVKPTRFGWPHALNTLFITSNLCFHDTSCSSWSLCHRNKGIMKYMVFIWVAVVFVVLYMDCCCRKHVKLQRVFFFLLKISPSVLNIHLPCKNVTPSFCFLHPYFLMEIYSDVYNIYCSHKKLLLATGPLSKV